MVTAFPKLTVATTLQSSSQGSTFSGTLVLRVFDANFAVIVVLSSRRTRVVGDPVMV